MIEIRLHGRGGHGVKKSAQILGRAAFHAGYKTQDFAIYGAERKGAPVTSFVRIDKKKISTRGHIFNPDFIIVVDDSVSDAILYAGKKDSTVVVINTHEESMGRYLHSVDATEVALEETGKPIPNIALLGAFAKVSGIIDMKDLEKAVREEMGKLGKEILEKNLKAAKRCYKLVK